MIGIGVFDFFCKSFFNASIGDAIQMKDFVPQHHNNMMA